MSPNKDVIRRGGEVFLDTKATAEAVRLNKTVGDMALRDGDEFTVPDRASSTTRWQTGRAVLTGLASVFWLVRSVSR